MDKQKDSEQFKKVSYIMLDHAPKLEQPRNWKGLAYAVSVLAMITSLSILLAFL